MSLSPAFAGLFYFQQSTTIVKRLLPSVKYYSVAVSHNTINDKSFKTDSYTNINPKIISRLSAKLYNLKHHPICLLKERIANYFYDTFKNKRGNPIFSLYDDLSPIVTPTQNFDSLLVPENHPSRSKSDCFYINQEWMLRSHMTAHQSDLIKMGLNNFLMAGDVFRKDTIDHCHYPVFHQLDGVRLFTPEELFAESDDGIGELDVMEKSKSERTNEKQEVHTISAVKRVEKELKKVLEGLSKDLFGSDVKYEWCDAVFPFTHPSWELNILLDGKWIEVLGCGVVEHKILQSAGCVNRIGWAFGLGLDRLAMIYYSVPDIRIFWSSDPAFMRQFEGKTCQEKITFKQFSAFPACYFDVSFWVNDSFDPTEFESSVRDHSYDIEDIQLIDSYVDPKSGKSSKCYRLFYRSMEKTFTKKELASTQKSLEAMITDKFNVKIR